MNVKLRCDFGLSVVLNRLERVELPLAMLTQTQSYWRQPYNPELAMGHAPQFPTAQSVYSSISDKYPLRE